MQADISEGRRRRGLLRVRRAGLGDHAGDQRLRSGDRHLRAGARHDGRGSRAARQPVQGRRLADRLERRSPPLRAGGADQAATRRGSRPAAGGRRA
jgi:hypothetical protein